MTLKKLFAVIIAGFLVIFETIITYLLDTGRDAISSGQ